MNFSGYVKLRRGIIEHTQNGKLSTVEALVLIYLILLADKSTGSGTINANVLAAFIGEGLDYESETPKNRQRGKQRVLHSLEAKGYIFREIVPHSKRAYRYWVNKYLVSDGPNKHKSLTLSPQLFETRDIKHIAYVEGVAEGVGETVGETVTSNKKGEERPKKKPSISTWQETLCGTSLETGQRTSSAPSGKASAEPCWEPSAEPGREPVYDTPTVVPFTFGDRIPGCRFVTGEDAHYRVIATNRRVADFHEAKRLAEAGGSIQ